MALSAGRDAMLFYTELNKTTTLLEIQFTLATSHATK